MKKSRIFTALGLTAVLIIGSTFSTYAYEFDSEDIGSDAMNNSFPQMYENAEDYLSDFQEQFIAIPYEILASEDDDESAVNTENSEEGETRKKAQTSDEDETEGQEDESDDKELGQQIVDYALTWVGVTPYVWAGNSLTSGTDCSGFVHLVYEYFDINVPRSSYDFRSFGSEVSYEDAKPGDIICYEGHVALYIGNGAIVHASDETTGTKITEDATYSQILTVRRVV